MDGELVGSVESIGRYPVKSLQGEFPHEAELGPAGMVADRSWGIVSTETGHVLSAKKYAPLLEASGHLNGNEVAVTLPDGTYLEAGDAADAALSDWLGKPVALRPANVDATKYEMSFNVDDESVDEFEWQTPPGNFLDLAPVHFLTTASLAAAELNYPAGDWNPHRFRPTLLIDAEGDDFIENGWTGRGLVIGDVVLDVLMPTIRCTMTTKAQPQFGITRDVDIFKSLKFANSQNLGAYANVRTPGVVRVGDPVTLLN